MPNAECPGDALYETAKTLPMWIAASFNKKGVRSEPVALVAKWKDAAALAKATTKGSLELLECGLWILEAFDRERALEEALAIAALPAPEPAVEFELLVRARAIHAVSRNADLLPLAALLDAAARGGLVYEVAKKAISDHPSLRTADHIVQALERCRWLATPSDASGYPRDRDLAAHLLEALRTLRFDAAVPRLEAMFRNAGAHEVRWRIATTLEELGSTLPRETLVAAAASGLLEDEGPINPAGDRRWPPILKRAVEAVFVTDPQTAYDRLEPYLVRARLTEAFLTHSSITTVGDAIAAVLEAHFLATDPRWAACIARLAKEDPWWERYAWKFQDLTAEERSDKLRAWKRRSKNAS